MLSFILNLFSFLISPKGLIVIIFGIISASILLAVALKPMRFWPLLLIFTIGAGGIAIRSVGFLDEYLIGCVLLGTFLAMSISAVRLKNSPKNRWEKLHLLAFLLMISYMVVQGVYGSLDGESLQKIRWPIYFAMLGIIALIISKDGFPVPSKRKLSLIIALSGLTYFLLYSASGLFYEIILGESRWNLLGGSWAGTTYTVFPLVAVIPALIFLFKDKRYAYRLIASITLLSIIFFSFYFESRISWLLIIGFFIAGLPLLGFRKVILSFITFLLVLSLFINFIWPKWFTADVFKNLLIDTTKAVWQPSEAHDTGRLMHLQIAFPIISSDWKTFLFGYGFRTSRPLIGPSLAKLWIERGRPDVAEKVKDYHSTIAFTALVTETGIIGLLLLILNFLFTARKILFKKIIQGKLMLLFSLLATFLWLLSGTVLDIVLFYLMIMPSGLLTQLSKSETE
ncbi:MAG: hypothetical protein WC297_02830 [Candidatus Paceibacterota bacterium]|jgi:hypothetical protein